MTEFSSNLTGSDGGPLGLYEDAARRISDTIWTHLLADRGHALGKWCAFRLSDGTSDGVLYDNPNDAADHQLHYKQCAYLQIIHSGISAREASVMLGYYRRVYDAGNVPPALRAYNIAKLALPGRNLS